MENYEKRDYSNDRDAELFSRSVKAGRRTYFFDVKSTRDKDYYLTLTESKRHLEDNGNFTYEKHKIFLYKEDFDKFVENLQDAIDYIKEYGPEIEPRAERKFSDTEDIGGAGF